MEHSSTLDPSGLTTPIVRSVMKASMPIANGYMGPVKVLMLAPFQYKYGNKSYWVTTGEWYSLDQVRDKEEILYLDSPSNPYRQFMYIEGQAGVGSVEEKGDVYSSGTGYQNLVSNPLPPLRSNALLPPEDPSENPHILETLARAGLNPSPLPVTTKVEDEVVPEIPDQVLDIPVYDDETAAPVEVEMAVVEGIEPIPQPTALEMREAELRFMKVPALKSLATTMGLEYKDKESTIKEMLGIH